MEEPDAGFLARVKAEAAAAVSTEE